ncbi:MAG: hypothetical protein ABSA11_16250, partial [Candidatus Bathyarchaeia archaeon]
MSAKDRMDEMLRTIEDAGSNGIEMRELLSIYYEKWGFRLATIKGYVSDLEEIGKIRVSGTMVYYFSYEPP